MQLVGSKYEMEGNRVAGMQLAQSHISECRTDARVASGPAYGNGFGLVTAGGEYTHSPDTATLFASLEEFVRGGSDSRG